MLAGWKSLTIISGQFDLHGRFWDMVNSLGDRFGLIGILIIGIFVVSWLASVAAYKLMGYHRLELAALPVEDQLVN